MTSKTTFLNYENQYGRLVLSPVTDVVHVDTISGKDIAAEHTFDLRTAEKIALITDNRGIQIVPVQGDDGKWVCYVVVQETPLTAAVAQIETLDYVGNNPTLEIRDRVRLAP
jgi:hypothetical protein